MSKTLKIKIRKLIKSDIGWIKKVFIERWRGNIITRGKIHNPIGLDGFIAGVDNQKVGLITFKISKKELEIISLDSFVEGKGVGTSLLNKIVNLSKKKKLKRIWLITTNDNLNALRFYQKRGFRLLKIYPNALEISRKLKPGIPMIGEDGIPLRDEIELEMRI